MGTSEPKAAPLQSDVAKDLGAMIQKMLDQQREVWTGIFELVSTDHETAALALDTSESDAMRRMLDTIRAKAFCSASEAAVLLGCSAQHLRNKVEQAVNGETEYPIPHANLDGPIVFPVDEL